MTSVIKLGLMLTLSISVLTGCGTATTTLATSTNVSDRALSTNSFGVSADTTTSTTATTSTGVTGDMGRGHGSKGGRGNEIFGLTSGITLTADQQTALAALKPAQTDDATRTANKAAVDTVQAEIKAAFVTDTFDVTALQAKLDTARGTSTVDRSTEEATRIVGTWNILTAEQKTTVETNMAANAANVPTVRPTPDPAQASARLDALATALTLTADQKTSIAALIQPSKGAAEETAEQAQRKASQDAVFAALKSGSATVEGVAAILKANTSSDTNKGDNLIRLGKIHDILTADQRTKYIASNYGFGSGGKGDQGGHGGKGGQGRRGR